MWVIVFRVLLNYLLTLDQHVVLIQQNLLLEKVTFTSLNKLDSFLKRLTGNASNTSFAIIKP